MMDSSQTTILIPVSLGFVQAFLLRGPERTVLIDTGTPQSEAKLLQALEAAGIPPQSISLILITHGHTDHFGSAAAMKAHTGAPVVIHHADADAMRKGINPRMPSRGFLTRIVQRFAARSPQPTPLEPDQVLDGELDLAPYGVTGRVIPTPGHSPGSVSIVLPAGDLIIGDLLMARFFVSKQPTLPFIIDQPQQLRRSLETLLALNPRQFYAAHGGPFTPEQVRKLLQK